ncbi:Cyclin-L1-1 [Acorus calamus]|uniref:Cyclin-L1-1 n=1 Tax=Acorus calamus TaxID=4465 RepID=A0AAV9CKR6_ACOCL|nr:Cyclin-L1-1 [Acorus calamus]
MIYTAIDTFYLTDEQLKNSPSRKDGIDEETETSLRIYGCDLIQESGILLRLPQQVMATGQVLFHRFYCKKSFARFNVKDFTRKYKNDIVLNHVDYIQPLSPLTRGHSPDDCLVTSIDGVKN